MRVTTRFVSIAFWVYVLTAAFSHAADAPSVALVGYQCKALRDEVASPIPGWNIFLCQIVDDGEPIPPRTVPPGGSEKIGSTPNAPRQRFINTADNASQPRRNATTPTPAP